MGFTFLAFAERERLQARRRKETTPERDARLDDQSRYAVLSSVHTLHSLSSVRMCQDLK